MWIIAVRPSMNGRISSPVEARSCISGPDVLLPAESGPPVLERHATFVRRRVQPPLRNLTPTVSPLLLVEGGPAEAILGCSSVDLSLLDAAAPRPLVDRSASTWLDGPLVPNWWSSRGGFHRTRSVDGSLGSSRPDVHPGSTSMLRAGSSTACLLS